MRKVTSPDGMSWKVSIDWTRRAIAPRHAYRSRRARNRRREEALDGAGDLLQVMPDVGGDFVAGLIAFVAFVVLGLLVWFVIWPLLAVAAELAVVVLLALAGMIARVCFGRPWIVEAVSAGGAEQRWRVRGMAGARRTIDQIADHIAAGVDPQPTEGEPVGPARRGPGRLDRNIGG